MDFAKLLVMVLPLLGLSLGLGFVVALPRFCVAEYGLRWIFSCSCSCHVWVFILIDGGIAVNNPVFSLLWGFFLIPWSLIFVVFYCLLSGPGLELARFKGNGFRIEGVGAMDLVLSCFAI
ncbi:hypothetical protein U1Q18_031145 [Sarracenia purpurea var. burkii]